MKTKEKEDIFKVVEGTKMSLLLSKENFEKSLDGNLTINDSYGIPEDRFRLMKKAITLAIREEVILGSGFNIIHILCRIENEKNEKFVYQNENELIVLTNLITQTLTMMRVETDITSLYLTILSRLSDEQLKKQTQEIREMEDIEFSVDPYYLKAQVFLEKLDRMGLDIDDISTKSPLNGSNGDEKDLPSLLKELSVALEGGKDE